MKFLCDQMLSRLGKWLRAAGHDTEIIRTPILDSKILALALATDRLLVTRDRHFLHIKDALPILVYLKSNDFEACIKEFNHKINIDWLYAPFSRCLICNSSLEESYPLEGIEQVPLEIRQKKSKFWYCPLCRHMYWEGSHTERMLRQLQSWQKEFQK